MYLDHMPSHGTIFSPAQTEHFSSPMRERAASAFGSVVAFPCPWHFGHSFSVLQWAMALSPRSSTGPQFSSQQSSHLPSASGSSGSSGGSRGGSGTRLQGHR